MLILEENFRWHLEAFASELFIYNITQNKYIIRIFNNKNFCILYHQQFQFECICNIKSIKFFIYIYIYIYILVINR